MVSFRSSFSLGSAALLVRARMRAITSPARFPSRTMRWTASRDFLHVRHISGQPAQAGAAVAHHARERLVDFMRDRSGQFPHDAHPVDVRKIRLELAQPLALFFGTFAVFNIGGHATPFDHLPTFVAQRDGAHLEPAIPSVGAATQPRFTLQSLTLSRRRPPRFDDFLEIVGVNCRLPAGTEPVSTDIPVNSTQRLFTKRAEPSGQSDPNAIAGMVSITFAKLLGLPSAVAGCGTGRPPTAAPEQRPRRGRETSWSSTRGA